MGKDFGSAIRDDPFVQELTELAAKLGVVTCFTPFERIDMSKMTKGFKGARSHPDEKEDKALIKKMVKKEDLKGAKSKKK